MDLVQKGSLLPSRLIPLCNTGASCMFPCSTDHIILPVTREGALPPAWVYLRRVADELSYNPLSMT